MNSIYEWYFGTGRLPCLTTKLKAEKRKDQRSLERSERKPVTIDVDKLMMGFYIGIDIEWLRMAAENDPNQFKQFIMKVMNSDYNPPGECDAMRTSAQTSSTTCSIPFNQTLSCTIKNKASIAHEKKDLLYSLVLAGMALKFDDKILVEALQLLVLSIGHSNFDEQREVDTLDLLFLTMGLEHLFSDLCLCSTSCFANYIAREDGFHKSIFHYALYDKEQYNPLNHHPDLPLRFILYAIEYMSRRGACGHEKIVKTCPDKEARNSLERSWIRNKLLASLVRPWVPASRSTLDPRDKIKYFIPLKEARVDIPAVLLGLAGEQANVKLAMLGFGARAVEELTIAFSADKTDLKLFYRICGWTDENEVQRERLKQRSLPVLQALLDASFFSDYTSGFGNDDQLSNREMWSLVNLMTQCAPVHERIS